MTPREQLLARSHTTKEYDVTTLTIITHHSPAFKTYFADFELSCLYIIGAGMAFRRAEGYYTIEGLEFAYHKATARELRIGGRVMISTHEDMRLVLPRELREEREKWMSAQLSDELGTTLRVSIDIPHHVSLVPSGSHFFGDELTMANARRKLANRQALIAAERAEREHHA